MKTIFKYCLSLLLVLCSAFSLFAGQSEDRWTTSPFDQKVFVENKGQFTSPLDKAKFCLRYKGTDIYFFPGGIQYRHASFKTMSEEIKERFEEAKEKNNTAKYKKLVQRYALPVILTLNMEWVGADASAEIIGEEEADNYFTY